ncbi:protein of unknown function [Burkholderia multivorans]
MNFPDWRAGLAGLEYTAFMETFRKFNFRSERQAQALA